MSWSVVIATHTDRRWDRLVEAVEAVEAQQPVPEEIILVVDHNDALLDRIRRHFADRVIAVANNQKQGPSGARNTGAIVATSEFMAYLDDDARPRAGWLKEMQIGFDAPDVIGIGGLAVPAWEDGAQPRWLPDEFLWVIGAHYRGHRTDAGPVRAPIGANMAFRRRHLVDAGGFTWQVARPPFARCEETEFAIRLAAQTGGHVEFIPTAVVDHFVPSERARWRYFLRRCRLEGQAKADLAAHIGTAATSVERRYALQTLGAGFVRHLGGLFRADLWAPLRALNLVVGFAMTASGFIEESLLRRVRPSRPHSSPTRTHPEESGTSESGDTSR